MFDLMNATSATTRPNDPHLPRHGGDTPRHAPGIAPDPDDWATTAGAPITTLLACALDEVDVGVLLLDADGRLRHANHIARHALADGHPLRLRDERLAARDPRDLARLHDALREAAWRGLRRMLALGDDGTVGGPRLVALVPALPGVAALLLGRTRMCEELSLQCFARSHALTGAETRVLAGLGRGESPAEIARAQGVKLSTVRTQVAAIRDKTGVGSITDLVRLVASLPPMVSALKH